MEDNKLSINEVIDEVEYWLEEEFPNDISPSEYKKAMEALDDLGMMDFDEMLENYPNLNSRFIEDFDFETTNPEFESKLDATITSHIAYLEETCDHLSDEENW